MRFLAERPIFPVRSARERAAGTLIQFGRTSRKARSFFLGSKITSTADFRLTGRPQSLRHRSASFATYSSGRLAFIFIFFLKTVNVKQPLWPFEEPQDLLHRNQELSNDAAIRQRLKRVIRYKQKLPCLFDLLQSSWVQKKAIFTDFATRHFQKDNTRCFRRRTTHYFTGFCYI